MVLNPYMHIFLLSKEFVFLSCVNIIRLEGKSIGCKMELPSKINNNEKSLQQGISPSGNGGLISNSKLTALVVDSDRICQILEKAILESQGVETQVVGSGRDALDLLASGATFNLIIIAMVLPIMNGVEVSLSFLYCVCSVYYMFNVWYCFTSLVKFINFPTI